MLRQPVNPDINEAVTVLERLTLFTNWRGGPEAQPELGQALAELAKTLEELTVSNEELCQQNALLAAARDRAEAQTRRYLELFNNAPCGYVVTDASGTVKEANRAAGLLLGVAPESMIGQVFTGSFLERDRQSLRENLSAVRQELTSRAWCTVAQRADSSIPFPLSIALAPVLTRHSTRPCGFRWALTDLSDATNADRRIRGLETSLWGRVAEETMRLNRDKEQLTLQVARLREELAVAPQTQAENPINGDNPSG
jgi:PAS domain S-box-containing protein